MKCKQMERKTDWYLSTWENKQQDEHAILNVASRLRETENTESDSGYFEINVMLNEEPVELLKKSCELDWKELVMCKEVLCFL